MSYFSISSEALLAPKKLGCFYCCISSVLRKTFKETPKLKPEHCCPAELLLLGTGQGSGTEGGRATELNKSTM